MLYYIFRFFIIILILLPFYLFFRRPWQKERGREFALGLFVLFILGLLVLALEGDYQSPVIMVREARMRLISGYGINLWPLRTIRGFFRHFIFNIFMVNIVGNIVMFIPWGFGLVLLWKKNRNPGLTLTFSLGLTLFIETCQLFIGRSVDVDDLILNFAGSCLGAGLYFLLKRRWPGIERFAE